MSTQPAIYIARTVIKELIEDIAEQGRLQEIALDQNKYVCYLAATALRQYVADGQVNIAMISRWVMEAVSNQARMKG